MSDPVTEGAQPTPIERPAAGRRALERSRELLLLGRVAAGDREAFAELFDRLSPLALGLLVRILGRRDEAEEVLQEVFLQVWRDAARYRPERASPVGWVLLLARSRALDHLRSVTARAEREHTVHRDGLWVAPPGEVVERLAAEERWSSVRSALGGLPDEQRRCIELAFFDGLSQSQIAARTATPLGTVKSRIAMGMSKLRHAVGA